MEKEKLDFINRVRKNAFLRNFVIGPSVLDFIACQFALESDFGRSDLAVKYHNFCGMRVPYRRVFYGSSKFVVDYAVYVSFDHCIIDYISWLLYNRPSNNNLTYLDSFIIFLRNSGYCPEKDYIDKIKSIYQQLKS